MSADNWSMCPLCEKKKNELMGKMNAKEFSEIKDSFLHPDYETEETVREDYEVYFQDGNYCFDAHAECGVCGAVWSDKIKIKRTSEPDWEFME